MALVNVTISDKAPVPASQGDIWINQATREVQMHNGLKFAPFVILTPQIDGNLTQVINGQTLTLTHALTADRTLTFPDATDTLVGRATTDTLTNKTLTSPHMTGPVVDSGGMAINGTNPLINGSGGSGTFVLIGAPDGLNIQNSANTNTNLAVSDAGLVQVARGGLEVTAGNVGIGSAPEDNASITIGGSTTSGSTQFGIISAPVVSSDSTSGALGVQARVCTEAASFTVNNAYTFYAAGPTKGAGSEITTLYGLYVDGLSQGATNNYGIYVSEPSGGSGVNLGAYIAGGLQVASGGGLQVGTPTGGDKGAGTINVATGVYLNGTAYTSPDFVFEHHYTGQIRVHKDKAMAATYRGLPTLDEMDSTLSLTHRLPYLDGAFGPGGKGHDIFSGGEALLLHLEQAFLYLIDHDKRLKALGG